MASLIISNIFSELDLNYLRCHPDVISARLRIDTNTSAYSDERFAIPITNTIRTSMLSLGLDLSQVTNIPMRWIKGDTAPHIDNGIGTFINTFLVYLNDSTGDFVVDGVEYAIRTNTAFVFSKGLSHFTVGTSNEPRLLFGPINDSANAVGRYPIQYYANYEDAINGSMPIAYGGDYVIGSNIVEGNIGPYTTWRAAPIMGYLDPPDGVYMNGFDMNTLGLGQYFNLYPSSPCLLEGTTVLAMVSGVKSFVPIETLRKGDLVQTGSSGFKKVVGIGMGRIGNMEDNIRVKNRLYECSPDQYPELAFPVYMTGCHSILVDSITDEQRKETITHLTKIYVTEQKFRLMAYIDKRATPWVSGGLYTIWHLALENTDSRMNYGIYVNGSTDKPGLLVETCSIFMLNNCSNFTLIN